MIVEVRDDDVARMSEDDAARRIELLPDGPVEAVLTQEEAVFGEELNAMVARVRDENLRRRRHGHIPWVIELTGFRTFFTEFK